MSEAIKITISPQAKRLLASAKAFPERIGPAMARALDKENQLTVAHIVKDYLSFPKDGPTTPIGCRAVSGRLRSSLRASPAVVTGAGASSAIGSNVEYAAAQEFGAEIPPHKITAKNGQALRFVIGGRTVFAKSVNHPGATLPGRGFVRCGIAERLPNYSRSLSNAIINSFAGQ